MEISALNNCKLCTSACKATSIALHARPIVIFNVHDSHKYKTLIALIFSVIGSPHGVQRFCYLHLVEMI